MENQNNISTTHAEASHHIPYRGRV